MNPFKPDGYTTVSPYLVVSDAAETIRFLEEAFGARLLRSFPDQHGRLMHSEVRIDDSIVMIADSAPAWPEVPSHVHIYVPDVDESYAHALAAGAKSVQQPVKKQDENKRASVKDAGGTTWWISTKVE
jgi:PhnB protein